MTGLVCRPTPVAFYRGVSLNPKLQPAGIDKQEWQRPEANIIYMSCLRLG